MITKRTLRGYEKGLREPAAEEKGTVKPEGKAVAKKVRPPLRRFTPQEVARLRAKLHASQGYFAMRLRVSPTTVQQWESGAKTPSPMATTLLETVDKQGLEILA